ncbi:carboxypeptidase S [Thozetella sp. PMI_491]|nr:carboxypeptidase S [Thozetella sp. PMI_491]
MEKAHLSSLPIAVGPPKKANCGRHRAKWLAVPLALASLALWHGGPLRWRPAPAVDYTAMCAQPDALFPKTHEGLDWAWNYLLSPEFEKGTVERLAAAVQIKTETFDDLGEIGVDKRWDVFQDFHAFLEKTFPAVHARLKVEKVNTWGLLYTWNGSDPSLKPTLLMAHQDTVPVPLETIPAWDYPPWSGHFDGKYVWGRGASDCKNQLLAVLETIELLLEGRFEPRRTILLSFGFDEESHGFHGAGNISAVVRDRYGNDGLAVVVDEGAGFQNAWGTLFAKPGTAEKGSTNVWITVRSPGGHSSIPHDHTSIGILSDLITQIEATQYPTYLADANPYFTQLQCGAKYSPDFSPELKKLLGERLQSPAPSHHTCRAKPDRLALEAAKQGPEIKYLMQTSQAVDVISGGVKVNALPERAQAIVNHRVNVGEKVEVVWDRLTRVAGHVAQKYGLTLHAFDGVEEPSSIVLSNHDSWLDPAPVTPADGSVNGPFAVLAGTVRALYGKDVIVTPGIMTGNTDTRFFWDLSKHLFRFAPGYDPEDAAGLGSIHTVNEKVSVKNHISAAKWFMLFVRNMDEADV